MPTTHRHTHVMPINGDWIDKDGIVHNLDGSVGHKTNNYNMQPFPGTFIDSNGDEQNIDQIAIFGSGGGGGGVTMAQVNSVVAAEAALRTTADDTERAARIAADAAEVTARNNAISTAIAAIPAGITAAQVDAKILVETNARVADVNAEETARIAADAALQTQIDTIVSTGGGVSQAQMDAAILVETNARIADVDTEEAARIAADNNEVTARNTAISNAIAALPAGITMTQVNAAVDVEKNARIAADAQEVTDRNTAITTAIGTEVTNRDAAIATAVSGITSQKMAVALSTGTLTNVINGTTNLAKSLFPDIANMKPGKVIINDSASTVGIYESDVDAATIQVRTISIDATGGGEDAWVLLGDVADKATFNASALSVASLTTLFSRTPDVMDRVGVKVDESQNNNFVEYIITDITGDAITYGNSRTINTSQYQTQTAVPDAGKVPIIGGTTGTWGTAKAIDTAVTPGSDNLVTSGAVATAIAGAAKTAKFAITGDNSTKIFVNPVPFTGFLMAQLWDISTLTAPVMVGADISYDATNISVGFDTAPAIGANYELLVMGGF